MHDDIPLTIGRARRVLDERILPEVHATAVPLDTAWHELPGEPIAPAEGLTLDFEPYEVGTPWGAAWGTTWFRLSGTVPAEWAGQRVEALVDLGFDKNMPGFQCEGLVYLSDGTPVKSLNPRNQWVLITESAVGGETVEFFVEAASNPVLLDYHPFLVTQEGDVRTSSPKRLYTSRRMDLAVFAAEVHELALDIDVLLELQEELPQGPRRMRILQALDDALDTLDLQHIPETAPDARAALAEVLAAPAEASAHRISAVGHAHIDSAWLWPVRETIRKVARTTSSMTELIGQTDDFLYGMSSAQQYAWIKEHRPEVYAKVKDAVAAGRFLPLGGMWVESDTVMPTGESIVRQFSQGQRFFEREFGIRPKGVWLPDSFGYSPALPQLMRRAGFEWFFTQKISWNQVNKFPHHTFLWEGIDGSRVFSHFPSMDTYNSRLSGSEVAKAARQFRENRLASGSIAPVGWGDGGGGTTREMTGVAARLADLEGSARVTWEHPDAFFDRAKSELGNPPVWVGELYLELHRATLTSQHQTKQGNRRSEHLLVEAELWCATAAARTDFAYPYDELDALWQQVLLQQFHDILPGTSIAWVHREAVERYAEIAARLEALIAAALSALAGDGDATVVVNPAPSLHGGALAQSAILTTDLEATTPVRLEEADGGFVLTNDLVRVVVDGRGLVTSAVDLATGRDAIAPGQVANLLQLHQDFPNMWDAWDVDRYYRNRVDDLVDVTALRGSVDEDGTARVSVSRSFSESTLTQEITLAPGTRTLEFDQVTDWHETEKFLKVAFPLDVRAEHTIAETQFGAQKRVTHTNTSWEAAKFETSMHRYVLVEEPGFGVALVNDSIHGFDVTRDAVDGHVTTTVRLSLLRAPRFPDPETDQGVQTHRYGLVIGTDVVGATAAGTVMNTSVRRIAGAHGFDSLVQASGGVVVSAVKLADDRSGDLVVRVYEPAGRRGTGGLAVDGPFGEPVEVTLLEETDPALPGVAAVTDGVAAFAVDAFEVRTFRFPRTSEER
ncbi:alpha-mannosidase [Curtobacterium sp. MCJR17_055]|uniref:alpha-mannosidase n=1 Tax=unclassified Curtobacterium TaxID=257496 RepID=UPI000D8ADD64|nr:MULTISPECIES: glycoside hydrolase family 38 C-terminal domain-containing protein [unclassified Curtobacterium]PYY34546.1 alpha-mannosidase [Curtobacterium sp. MCBD17_029]PYY57638.1 alpha-mannosidase [Curtobacterium sp. MCPF17_015]PYY58296.1 alpha-mannosidase [Curtobacterium sp. MCJR17_055]